MPAPRARPGMPEAGSLPDPDEAGGAPPGVKDMIRISSPMARHERATAFGTIVLHVAPESAIGRARSRLGQGPVTASRSTCPSAKLEPCWSQPTSSPRRRKTWKPPAPHNGSDRGYTGPVPSHSPCRPTQGRRLFPTSWGRRSSEDITRHWSAMSDTTLPKIFPSSSRASTLPRLYR